MGVLRRQRASDQADEIVGRRIEAKTFDVEARGRKQVAFFVADQETPLAIDRPFAHRLFQQTGRGFAASAYRRIAGDAALRVMRAIIKGIDMRAAFGQRFLHMGVQALNVGLLVKATGDAGLIGDHNRQMSRLIEHTHGLGRTGNPFELFRPADIAVVDIEHAVTIEKGDRI